MVCDQPHLIIWAKKPNARYFPAKIMSTTEREVYVRFFGGFHLNINVPVQKCFLYSKDTPGFPNAKPSNEYTKALQEADRYIENLRAKFGSFNYAEPRTQFDPMSFNRHIHQIILNDYQPNVSTVDSNRNDIQENFERKTELTRQISPKMLQLDVIDDNVQPHEIDEPHESAIDEIMRKYEGSEFLYDTESESNDDIQTSGTEVNSNENTMDDISPPSSGKYDDEMKTDDKSFDKDKSSRQSAPSSIKLEPVDIKFEEEIENDGEPSAKRFAFGNDIPKNVPSNNDSSYNIEPESTQPESRSNGNGGESDDYIRQLMNVANGFANLQNELKTANEKIELMKKREEKMKKEWKNTENQLLNIQKSHVQQINELKEEIDELKAQHTNELPGNYEHYERAIEEAKKNKYCLACDTPTLFTDIYVCDINCHRKYWDSKARELNEEI